MDAIRVIFFDLGDTLGSPIFTPPPVHLASLHVYPYVPDVLRRLARDPGRLGVISNTGDDGLGEVNAVLKSCGLLDFFEAPLLLYSKDTHLRKDSPAVFQLAAQRAAVPIARTLFVGEDASERMHALTAGMRVCPHPLLVPDVIAGEPLRYATITVPAHLAERAWKLLLVETGVLPLRVSGPGGTVVTAIISHRMAAELVNRQFEVVLLGSADQPLASELYLLRDDRAIRTGMQSSTGQCETLFASPQTCANVLAANAEGVLVAVPGDRSVESYHLAEAYHGHNEKLMADPRLLQGFGRGPTEQAASFLEQAVAVGELDELARQAIASLSAASIKSLVDRYCGAAPLSQGDDFRVLSRHIHGPHMDRVESALAADLASIGGGLTVRMHGFSHEGRRYHNVEGELGGSAPADQRGIVIVCAHLDSTAASSPGYQAASDPAPGADDDASGLAAVLAIARALCTLPPPKNSVRFVLFNAEEHGLVGSKAYAKDQALQGAPIVGVYQMDMIGHNATSPPTFQVHAGFLPSADVQVRSAALGERVQHLLGAVSPELPVPRLFRSLSPAPHERDPAENRSDHSAFQQRGYAACAVTEDFAFGPPFDDPTAEVNPHYHRLSDRGEHLDFGYAAAIARVVAAAAWLTANPQP